MTTAEVARGAEVGRAAEPSDLRPVVASGVLRALVLPLAAVLNLVETAVLVGGVGPGSYGAVVLVGTVFQLLPFADLGVGAAMTRAIAAAPDPRTDPYVASVFRRCVRLLCVSAAVLALVAVALGGSGLWPRLLGLHGEVSSPGLVATLTIVLFAASLPFGLGQRILTGAGKNHVLVAASVVQPVVALLVAVAVRLASGPSGAYVLVFPGALLVTMIVMTVLAIRLTGIAPSLAGPADARVLPVALPMFLLTVGLPIGLQSDKIVLGHRVPESLSEYALAFQLYAPLWAVLSTAAFALLPVFTRRRSLGLPHRALWLRATGGFAVLAALAGGALVLLGPLVVRLQTDGRVPVGLDLRLALAALLVLQITGLVSGMLLNSPDELRFQAACVLNMMVANVGLSWLLAGSLGVAGPVIASAVSIGLLMTVPAAVAAWRTAS